MEVEVRKEKMNSLIVPPSPNWYEVNILACAPDNTLVYGARNDIVILENNANPNQAADVRIISRAHPCKVLSINLNRSWGQPKKFAVSFADDKIVKIWDVETGKKHLSHDKHFPDKKIIGATFAGDERVISVSEDGNIVIWSVSVNETSVLKDVFATKVTVTCMSTNPHASWMTAFGLKSGLIVVTDLRKNGKILHKLRGHDKPVLSLAWCPVPINIFPAVPGNYVVQKKILTDKEDDTNQQKSDSTEDIVQNINSGTENSIEENVTNLGTNNEISEVIPNTQQVLTDKSEITKDNTIKDPIQQTDLNKQNEDVVNNTNSTDEIENIKQPDDTTNDAVATSEVHHPSCKEKVISIKDGGSEPTQLQKSTPSVAPSESVSDVDESTNEVGSKSNEKVISVEDGIEKSTPSEIVSESLSESDTKSCAEIEDGSGEPAKIEESTPLEATSESVSDVDESKKSENKKRPKSCGEVGRNIVKTVPVNEEPRKEMLLASSAKENNIYIWRAGTDGRMETFVTLPFKSPKSKNKSSADKCWIPLCWISPTTLLSSSKYNELLAWTLPKPKDGAKVSIIQNDHFSQMFSIAGPVVLYNEYNWRDASQTLNAWTFSQDKLLLNTSLNKERTNLACYPTFGGNIQCLQSSPLDPNRLAVATADFFVKTWDLSRPHVKNIIMNNFYQKIQSRVSALAWHPSNEQILAFGTVEGRVGYVDPNNRSKMTVLLKPYFRSQIYKLEWAPLNGNPDNFGLYVVSEGRIAFFDTSKNEDPVEVNKPDDVFIYSFGWIPDYSLMLAITKAGYIIVYSPKLKILCKHYLQYRLQEVVWHPNACDSTSTQYKWFATIANLKNVVVYKFDIDSGNNDENIVNIYQTEADLIHTMAWNPHVPNQLVIGTDIGVAQIWDVECGVIIASFVNTNYEAITSVIWSPIDPNYVISGGKDNTLKIWKVSELVPQDEKEIVKARKKSLKDILSENGHTLPEPEEVEDQNSKGKKTKNGILPNFYSPKDTSQMVADLRKLLSWRETQENNATESMDYSRNDILNVFGSDAAMVNLVQANETAHKQRGHYAYSTTLSLFRGDISTAIKEAIDDKRVNLGIISLAPMVSAKLWQAACKTYADQLSELSDSDPLEIATYYLACHKVQEAVDILCDWFMYREALALAKSRMLGNEVVSGVVEKWAVHARNDGNFEVAAQCYIYLGKFEEAASLLFRRTDLKILEFVVELSEKVENEELHKAALFRFNTYNTRYEEKKLPTREEAVLHQKQLNEKADDNEQNNGHINIDEDNPQCLPECNNKDIEIEDNVQNDSGTTNTTSEISVKDDNDESNNCIKGDSCPTTDITENVEESCKSDDMKIKLSIQNISVTSTEIPLKNDETDNNKSQINVIST